jgi:hypothetical protein
VIFSENFPTSELFSERPITVNPLQKKVRRRMTRRSDDLPLLKLERQIVFTFFSMSTWPSAGSTPDTAVMLEDGDSEQDLVDYLTHLDNSELLDELTHLLNGATRLFHEMQTRFSHLESPTRKLPKLNVPSVNKTDTTAVENTVSNNSAVMHGISQNQFSSKRVPLR